MYLSIIQNGFVCLIVWAGVKQSRSPGAEQTTQVGVYQSPVGVDGLATLALAPKNTFCNLDKYIQCVQILRVAKWE